MFTSKPRTNQQSCDLLTITHGLIVAQIVKDSPNIEAANEALEKLGYRLGLKLIEEYLIKSGCETCENFKDTSEHLAKNAFKMFLGISADVKDFDDQSFTLEFSNNPLNDYVELPEDLANLHFSNIICGVIRGALEAVLYSVKCTYTKDTLKGNSSNCIKVDLIKRIIYKDDD